MNERRARGLLLFFDQLPICFLGSRALARIPPQRFPDQPLIIDFCLGWVSLVWTPVGMVGGPRVREIALNRLLPTTIGDRKSTRLNSSHVAISYAVFCLKKKRARHAVYSDD